MQTLYVSPLPQVMRTAYRLAAWGAWRHAAAIALVLMLSLFSFETVVAAPLVGSVIANTAQATYFDTDSGFNSKISSNTVQVVVQALEALSLTADNAVIRPEGGFAVLPHRLTNTGNTPSNYLLAYGNRTGDDFDLLSLELVWDQNGNGIADSGEPKLLNGGNFGPLAPGQFADFVLVGVIPTSIALDRLARVGLTATTVAQGVSATNTDSVTVRNTALLQLVKSASNLNPSPGDIVKFTLTASNTGNQSATGVPVLVDGVLQTLVLLRDVIPPNTTFSALGAVGTAVALYHQQGQPEYSYSTLPPVDLRLVDVVAFGFPAPILPGQSLARSLDIKINATASTSVTNVANLVFLDSARTLPFSSNSNSVRLILPAVAPTLKLYSDAQYTRLATVISAGQPFYVAVVAAQCNTDPLLAESKSVLITSKLTGDTEELIATETGPNTGEFRIAPNVPTSDALVIPLAQGNGVLSVKPNDKVTVSMPGCGSVLMSANLLVDPFGVVFDSKTNVLIAGAVVTLIDVTGAGNGGNPGGPARVFLADGLTPAPSTLTTGANGHYQFPLVAPSIYRLRVTPPASHSFPSVLPLNLLPADRVTDFGSYGRDFEITALTPPVQLDIPVDGSPGTGLFIEKSAARKTVELGDFLDYSIKVKNVSGQLLGRIRVTDRLPAGFAYLPGSARLNAGTARLNNSVLPEPEGGVGPVLVFNAGSIQDQAEMVLTYRVRVGPGARQGDGINRAQATSAGPLVKVSNESSAAVKILPGVFTDRGFLIGSVYADCNNNRQRDEGEPGVPGVRLFLEDGTNVTTDAKGKYSLYGLRPQTHVLKLDSSTLPAGAVTLAVLGNRNAGDAGSRFVDLKNGELHKADFAIAGCSPDLMQAIEARTALTAAADASAVSAQISRLAADTRVVQQANVNAQGLPASGVLGAAVVASVAAVPANVVSALPRSAASNSARTPRPIVVDLSDEKIAAMDNSLAIVSPLAGQVLDYAQTTIVIKGDMDANLTVSVNGVALPPGRIGKQSQLGSQRLQVVEYVGVDLKVGKNEIAVVQTPAAGQAGGSQAISVIAPGVLARLKLSVPSLALPADGRSPVQITLETLDAAGVAVTARTAITLDSSLGRWKAFDLNPDEPGVQIFVEGGRSVLELESPLQAGDALVRASAGSLTTQAKLSFVPELRPLIAAGVVEGVLNLRRLDSRALQPVRAQDGFEQELSRVARSFDNGRTTAAARAALFLKGKVQGDYLLTLAYDSDKDTKERLFRDIQPGEFYPVYGDSSVRGFDAQSTGRLYVRVDKGKSHVLYGDFNTQIKAPAALAGTAGDERRLGQYSRSLTGVQAQFESADARSRVNTFVSYNNSRQIVDELPARGVSGPYAIAKFPLLENSEKIEILTRDRNQPAIVLKAQSLVRFVDYMIETLTGQILLKTALPSLDLNFNPNSLRITYEVETGGENFWVTGVDASYQLTDSLTLGAGLLRDKDPLKPLSMQSAGITAKLAERTVVVAEMALTQTPLSEQNRGQAVRAEIRHEDGPLKAQAYVIRADTGFDNPSASIEKGRQEISAKASYKATDVLLFKGEYLRSEYTQTQVMREGMQVGIDYSFTDKLRGELGLRRSHATAVAAIAASTVVAPTDSSSVLVKITGQIPGYPQASAFGEYEQDVAQSSRRVAAVGGEYRLANATRLYGRHEFISSLGNRYGLNDTQRRNATVFGVQSDTAKDLNVFSEYRVRDAIEGRDAEVAIGLRNRWQLQPGLRVSAGYERVRSLSGVVAGESTVLSGGIEYTGAPNWKGALRLELRNSSSSDTVLATAGAAFKIDEEWSVLAKNVLSVLKNRSGTSMNKTEDWAQLGLAYRSTGANPYNGLLRAEYRYENTDALAALESIRRDVVITSAHLNYQLNPDVLLSGRAAAKWVNDRSLGLVSKYDTQLFSARATHDLSKRWDIGLNAAALLGGSTRSRQLGLGAELGYLMADNLWFSVGYNVFGFIDKDLTAQDYTNRGIYLRLRWKFDEKLFQGVGK